MVKFCKGKKVKFGKRKKVKFGKEKKVKFGLASEGVRKQFGPPLAVPN